MLNKFLVRTYIFAESFGREGGALGILTWGCRMLGTERYTGNPPPHECCL